MMKEKNSCCCKALPKGLWWLLTLAGLGLLYFLMFNANKDPIEADLTQRIQQQLADKGMDWVKVDVDERGRDILLSGTAPSQAAGEQALSLVSQVEGVRIAEAEFTEFVATEDMVLNATFKAGKITLEGTVANQKEADTIVSAAADRVGSDNVINQLVVDKNVRTTAWLNKLGDLFALGSDDGGINISPQGIQYSGTVESETRQGEIISEAKSLLGASGINVIDALTVVAPEPEPEPEPVAAEPAEAETAPPAPEEEGEEETAAREEETADDTDEKTTAREEAAADDTDRQTAATEEEPEETTTAEPEEEAEPEQAAATEPEPEPEPTEQEKAITACQDKLNETMDGKSIHFKTNSATIKAESYALLDKIASVMTECRDAISGGVSINGHTDSRGDDDYNMALSLRRAEAVKKYLAEHQVSSSLMKSVGHGETSPIASNDTPEGRAQNRRITFIIIKDNP